MTSLISSLASLAADLAKIIHQAVTGQLTPEQARDAASSRVKAAEMDLERLPADQAADFDVLRDG